MLQMGLGVNLEVAPRGRERKRLDELVRRENAKEFFASPTSRDILDSNRHKLKQLPIRTDGIQRVLVDESLNVELSQHNLFQRPVITVHSEIFVLTRIPYISIKTSNEIPLRQANN
jgi:hypothetical protein